MALNIFLSQKTNRHVVKKLNSSYSYISSFGSFGVSKADNTGLNNPIGIAADTSNNIYVCDSKNLRIVKLNSSLSYVSSLDLGALNLGKPYSIMFDSVSGDLYVVGLYRDFEVSIARITTALSVVKANNNIYSEAKEKPYGICKSFATNDFIISLGSKLIKVTETANFTFTAVNVIVGETINASHEEALIKEKKFNLLNKPVVPTTYTLWRTYTESPTQLTTSTFLTLHFPVLGTPDVNFIVYKNEVELDYDVALNDPNDYIINQATGFITLQKPVISTDKIYIRYKHQMIDAIDYTLDVYSGLIKLTAGVSEDWNINRDIIEINYTYANVATIQTISGISNANITGILKHSNGDMYVAQNTLSDAGKISKVNSSYTNIGDSNKVSKYIIGLTEALDGSLLTYDSDNQKIVRYSSNLNFVEDIYNDNKKIDQPPTLSGPHQYQLSLTPVLENSERVHAGSEVLLRNSYSLNLISGLLTIQKVTDEPPIINVYGLSYQLNKYPIETGSELVYVDNVLQVSGYTLNYSTGNLVFSPVVSGAVKVEYYRNMTVDKIEFSCVNNVVELDAFDVFGIFELNI